MLAPPPTQRAIKSGQLLPHQWVPVELTLLTSADAHFPPTERPLHHAALYQSGSLYENPRKLLIDRIVQGGNARWAFATLRLGDVYTEDFLGQFSTGVDMNLTDATLVLLLAARIHGTDAAIRASAKRW